MKQKSSNASTVRVPKSTLMAIKAMLFNSENGVDLSSIINDLSSVQADPDLTAINVALVFKGISVDTGENLRFKPDYRSYYENTFESCSIILDQVAYSYKYYRVQDDGTYKESDCGFATCSVSEWLDMSTELDLSKVRGV